MITRCSTYRVRTTSTSGPRRVTRAMRARPRVSTFPKARSAMRTLTTMARGATCRSTATSGIQTRSRPTGHPIAVATGPGSIHGVGAGSTARRGASRHSTTVVGPTSTIAGAGPPVAAAAALRSMPPRWSDSSAAAAGVQTSRSAAVVRSAGSRLGRETCMCRGIRPRAITSRTSTCATRRSSTTPTSRTSTTTIRTVARSTTPTMRTEPMSPQ